MLVTLGGGDGGDTMLGDTHEVVGVGCGLAGVYGDAQGTVGPVLEADREGQT